MCGACATLLEEGASVAASLAINSAGRGSLGGRGDRTAGAAARLAQSARLLEGALGIRRSSEPFPGADERPRGAVGSKVKKAEEGRGGERRRRRPPRSPPRGGPRSPPLDTLTDDDDVPMATTDMLGARGLTAELTVKTLVSQVSRQFFTESVELTVKRTFG